MSRWLRTTLIFCLAMLLSSSACLRTRVDGTVPKPDANAAAQQPMQAPFVEALLFGYWEAEPYTSNWVETRDIPQRPGLLFGWRMKLKEPYGKYVRIIERLTAPTGPQTWGPLERRHLVSSDHQVATVPNSLKVREGWIQRSNWMISEGDPLGDYQMEIQVNGRMAMRFVFKVVPDTGPPPAVEEEGEDIQDEIIEDGEGEEEEPAVPETGPAPPAP
ncbi:MAG: hypothetical protein GX444_11580 [Myxococcales bacterium]|nr:hypothetical protein [Myxococcales bacterium]